ncbi:MAG: DNA repair exonuclease [Clostridiales bacterium]|nr:DNA repair exonuclease [Clostridiales bacterium]
MKFIHIADVHLGATPDSNMPWGEQRAREIWSNLEYIINVCNEEEVDLLLIAGDLFHRQPLVRELKELNYLFKKLQTTQVVIMAGNHDYISARSNYQGFAWDNRVHMFLNSAIEIIEFPELNTQVYGFSYLQRDITESLYDDIKPQDNEKIHILLAHGGDEKNIPINRSKLKQTGFDYIALGHIHKPEIISDRIAYSGSLEPLDKNEIGDRGYIFGEITIKDNGERHTCIRFVPSAHRRYIRLTLTVDINTTNGSLQDQVREAIKSNGEQNVYLFYVEGIRDETIHFDKEALKSLGNILEIVDQSVPDYDFDAIYRDNSDNLIGLFVQKVRENAEHDEVAKKALYYGIEALLGARDH